MKPRLDRRGFTLVEITVALFLLGGLIVLVVTGFHHISRGQRQWQVRTEADQVDNLLEAEVLRRVWRFIATNTPSCNASTFSSVISGTPFPGVGISLLTPQNIDSELPAGTIGEAGLAAKERCRSRQTPFAFPSFGSRQTFYFCLRLRAAGNTPSRGSILSHRSVFAEVSFSMRDAETGNAVSCAAFAGRDSIDRTPVGLLVYGLYWTSEEGTGPPLFHHRIAMISRGLRP